MRSFFLGKNPIRWLMGTLRAKGLLRVFKVGWYSIVDASWDFVHGTETLTRIAPQDIETDSSNKSHASYYGATRARPLMRLFKQLQLPRDAGFVDLGAGKGRVIMIAALYGFRRIVAIDFSEPLCQLARKNVEAFRRRRKVTSQISIVHTDVVDYPFQSDETTFFLYDPFSSEVLTRVLQNLGQSLASHPRQIWLIYNSPRHHDVVERCGLFADSRHFEIGGTEFRVYGTARFLTAGNSSASAALRNSRSGPEVA